MLVILVLGGAGFVMQNRTTESAVVLRWAAIQRGDLVVTISATGTVEPEEVIDVGAQVAGQIMSFGTDVDGKSVDYGSVIEVNTVLANIDASLCASEVAQAAAQVISARGGMQRAQADLEQMKTKRDQAERDWKRAQQMGNSSALSGTDFDAYRSTFQAATANVAVGEAAIVQAEGSEAQARALLDRARRNLGYCTIRSPVKGVIIDRRVNIGQTVVASLNAPSLFLIAKDLTRMQVWVAVNEADVGRLHPGQPVSFTVDAFPGETFKGQVGKIRLNASMTQNVVTYTAEIVADNANGRLLPYLTANVKFELTRSDRALLVPNAALRWTPTLAQVAPQFRKMVEGWTQSSTDAEGLAASQPAQTQPSGENRGILWVAEGEFVRPLVVDVGLTDEVITEVRGEDLAEGIRVVTGQVDAADVEAVNSNPFLPKPPRGGKGGPPPPM